MIAPPATSNERFAAPGATPSEFDRLRNPPESAAFDGRFRAAAWWATQVCLLALAAWTLDALLMKRYLDRPWLILLGLTGIFALVGAASWMARRLPQETHLPLRAVWRRIGPHELVFVALALSFLFVFHGEFQRARVDGRAYFAQVRSFVMDRDADFSNENRDFAVQGSADHFASGAPFLWVPFFLAAHLWLAGLNLFGGNYPLNGYFNPYQRAIGIGTIAYGVAGLVIIQRLLSRYFADKVATLATVAVCLGSFIGWYVSVDVSYAHGVSMFTTALFVYYWDTSRARAPAAPGAAARSIPARGERTVREWLILGALGGVMSMARWQNLLFVIIPAGEAIAGLRRGALRDLLPRYAAFAGALILAFSPQMLVWKLFRGSWFDMPDEVHPIRWLHPDPLRELFSSDRGLFAWTPLLLFAILGLFLFVRRERLVGTLLIAAFAAQVYISSTILSVGHGPGARKFVNCAVIFALGLAALIEWLQRHPLVAPAAAIAALITVNLAFNADLRTTDVEQQTAVPALRILQATTSRLGNPFVLPMNAWVAWRYGVTLSSWDRLGSREYNNVHIDLGSENDDKFLGRGWSDREGAGESSFRWAVGTESTLLVPLYESDRYAVEMRARAFSFEGAPRQIVEVWLNGDLAGRLAVGTEMEWHRLVVDAGLVRAGLNGVRLRYSYAESPRAHGQSDDARPLAVQFDQLDLIRNPS